MIRYMEVKDALAELLKTKEDMQTQLKPRIANLASPLSRTCMELRYLEDRSSEDISERLFYSKQHVDRILRKSEKEIIQGKNYQHDIDDDTEA